MNIMNVMNIMKFNRKIMNINRKIIIIKCDEKINI